MRRLLTRVTLTLVLAGALSLLVVPVANAYIDPGTGSVIFQAVIAGAMAAGLALKLTWRRFNSLFSGRRPEDSGAGYEPAD
jgi:hypothetical protein